LLRHAASLPSIIQTQYPDPASEPPHGWQIAALGQVAPGMAKLIFGNGLAAAWRRWQTRVARSIRWL
jgi:hypothetical protein